MKGFSPFRWRSNDHPMSDEENKNEEQKVEETPEVEPQAEAAPEEKPAEESKAEPKEEAQAAEVEAPEAEAPAAEVSEEEITGREASEETEEEIVPEEVKELPYQDITPGMMVRVHERILDVSPKGDKRERIQVCQGMVIGMKGGGVSKTMTVRKDSKGWMVEKIYPLSSPNVTKVEVVKKYRVRRAKLNFLKKSTKRGFKKRRFKRKMKEVKSETK